MKLNCILLIDDDRICNYLHEKILRRLNVSEDILSASNGLEALKLLQEYYQKHRVPPDLILLDLKMPVMDGFEFIKNFQEKFPKLISQTQITIVSTSGHPSDVQKVSRLRNTGFYIKPLTEEKIKTICDSTQRAGIHTQEKVLISNTPIVHGTPNNFP